MGREFGSDTGEIIINPSLFFKGRLPKTGERVSNINLKINKK
jgi:hypothetical protein